MARFYRVKDEVRVIGFDDGPFNRGDRQALVVGAVFRGGLSLDGVVSTSVEVDGLDATDRLIELITRLRFKDVRVVMLDGLGFAGFNLVDIHRLHRDGGLPVIACVRRKPNLPEIRAALANLPDFSRRWACVESAGEPVPVETKPEKPIHIQYAGVSEKDAKALVKTCATRSMLPEAIRAAHLIAAGVVAGESRGHA